MMELHGSKEFERLERDGWSKPGRGATYLRSFGPLTRRFIGPLLDTVGVGPGQRVLDMGCGPGFVAAEAARRGVDVVGADFSMDMVETARRLNPGLEFHQADAENPGFPATSFDVVVANFLLQHVADVERTLAAFARMLRQGGRVGFTNWLFPEGSMQWVFNSEASQVAAREGVALPPGPDLQLLEDPVALDKILGAAGFKDSSTQTESFPYVLTDENELWEMMRAAVRGAALIDRLSTDGIAAVRAGVKQRLESFRTPDGYAVTLNARITTAHK